MSDAKLRIGVVGLGTFVEIAHMPTYFNSRYARFLDVAGICDVNADRLKEWGQKYNIAGQYTSLDEMLRQGQPRRRYHRDAPTTRIRRSLSRPWRPAATCWSRSPWR